MKKINLKDVKKGLKRDEMRMLVGGSGSQACTWRCKNGNTSGSSSSTTYAQAVSYATSVCGAGNFSLVCAG